METLSTYSHTKHLLDKDHYDIEEQSIPSKVSYLPPLRYLQDDCKGTNTNIYKDHDDAYSTVSRALLFKSEAYSKENHVLFKILSTCLTTKDQKLFADAHVDRAGSIPTFRERGESPLIDLVRRLDSIFGEVLLDIHADDCGNLAAKYQFPLVSEIQHHEGIQEEREISTLTKGRETLIKKNQSARFLPIPDNEILRKEVRDDTNEEEDTINLSATMESSSSVNQESQTVSGRYLPVYESSFDRLYDEMVVGDSSDVACGQHDKLSEVKSHSKLRQHLMSEINITNELLSRSDDDTEKRVYKKQLRSLMEQFCALNSSKNDEEMVKNPKRKKKKRRASISDKNVIFELEAPELSSNDALKVKRDNVQMCHPRSSVTTATQHLIFATNDVTFVDIVAPIAMREGFMFEASYNGFSFIAKVPNGGVSKGQVFTSKMLRTRQEDVTLFEFENAFDSMNIPYGRWRNGLCNIMKDPLLFLAICFPHVSLIQLQTRMHYIQDRHIVKQSNNGTIPLLLLTFAVVGIHVFMALALLLFDTDYQTWMSILYLVIFVGVLDVGGIAYFIASTVRLRRKVREHFSIRGSLAKDICLSIFCYPCVLSQMGRHTAEYETYTTQCISETGLPRRFSSLVPSQGSIQQSKV